MARFNGDAPLPDCVVRKMSAADRKALGMETRQETTARVTAKLERDLHDDIETWLRLRGITYRHDRMDKRTTGTVGWPDFTFAIKGKAVALEVKRPGEHPTDDQIRVMAGMARDGWHVRVVHSLVEAIAAVKEVA